MQQSIIEDDCIGDDQHDWHLLSATLTSTSSMQQAGAAEGSSAGEAAAAQVWEHIQDGAQGIWEPENCCLAAGALCTVLPSRARRLATAITSFLQEKLQSQR